MIYVYLTGMQTQRTLSSSVPLLLSRTLEVFTTNRS